LNKYLYGYANPGVYVDPDGREAFTPDTERHYRMLHQTDPSKVAALRVEDAQARQESTARVRAAGNRGIGLGTALAEGVQASNEAARDIHLAQHGDRGAQLRVYDRLGEAADVVVNPGRNYDEARTRQADQFELRADLYREGRVDEAQQLEGRMAAPFVAAVAPLARIGSSVRAAPLDEQAKVRIAEGQGGEQSVVASRPRVAAVSQPGDADFIGPQERGGWVLAPNGMGAHLVERVNVAGRPELAPLDTRQTPRYYPAGTPENAGRAHMRLHKATAAEGLERRGGNPSMSVSDLMDAYSRAYSRPEVEGITGDLRAPKGQPLLRDASPLEAFSALRDWYNSALESNE
jgi:hypothetical protein